MNFYIVVRTDSDGNPQEVLDSGSLEKCEKWFNHLQKYYPQGHYALLHINKVTTLRKQ